MQTGSLGGIVFEVNTCRVRTPRDVSVETSANFSEHAVLGAAPRLEFTAPALTVYSLSLGLVEGLGVSPVREAERLRGLCQAGVAVRLILAGKNCGMVVIESVSETWRGMTADGGVARIDVSLKLKEYL